MKRSTAAGRSNFELSLRLAALNPSSDTRSCTQCTRQVPKTQTLLTCEKCREKEKRKKDRRRERKAAGLDASWSTMGPQAKQAAFQVILDKFEREQEETKDTARKGNANAKAGPSGSSSTGTVSAMNTRRNPAIVAHHEEQILTRDTSTASDEPRTSASMVETSNSVQPDVTNSANALSTYSLPQTSATRIPHDSGPSTTHSSGSGPKRKYDDSDWEAVVKRLKFELAETSRMIRAGEHILTPSPSPEPARTRSQALPSDSKPKPKSKPRPKAKPTKSLLSTTSANDNTPALVPTIMIDLRGGRRTRTAIAATPRGTAPPPVPVHKIPTPTPAPAPAPLLPKYVPVTSAWRESRYTDIPTPAPTPAPASVPTRRARTSIVHTPLSTPTPVFTTYNAPPTPTPTPSSSQPQPKKGKQQSSLSSFFQIVPKKTQDNGR